MFKSWCPHRLENLKNGRAFFSQGILNLLDKSQGNLHKILKKSQQILGIFYIFSVIRILDNFYFIFTFFMIFCDFFPLFTNGMYFLIKRFKNTGKVKTICQWEKNGNHAIVFCCIDKCSKTCHLRLLKMALKIGSSWKLA